MCAHCGNVREGGGRIFVPERWYTVQKYEVIDGYFLPSVRIIRVSLGFTMSIICTSIGNTFDQNCKSNGYTFIVRPMEE